MTRRSTLSVFAAALALGAMTFVLALSSCASALPMSGDWIGDRNSQVQTNVRSPADVTLNRVKLTITDDGRFTLIDKSLPYEGRLDMTAKTQTLNIESIVGHSAAHMPVGSVPAYTLTWIDKDSIEVEGPETDIVLHRNPKPPGS